jgi:hypothetical protein
MLKVKPATVEHNGVEYEAELGTIKFTRLGKEDHGIYTFVLDFDFGHAGQGAGAYNLNDPEILGKGIQGVLSFFGSYTQWEDLPGKRAFVLREEHSGFIRGLMDEAGSKVIIFKELFE